MDVFVAGLRFISTFVSTSINLMNSSPPPPQPHSSFPDLENQTQSETSIPPHVPCAAAPAQHLGKRVLVFIYPTAFSVLAVYLQFLQNQSPIPSSFNFLSLTLLLAFSTSLIGSLLHSAFPAFSKLLEQMGAAFALLVFFIVMQMTLPPILNWLVWVLCALSVFSFLIRYKHKRDLEAVDSLGR